MSTSSIASANVATRFKKKVRREYVRGGRFGPAIGTDENKIIQVVRETKKCSLPLVGKLGGPGVRGSTQLSGSEEPLSNYAVTLQPTYHRQGVLIDNEENEKSEFDLFSESRPALMNWMMETKRDQIIQALGAVEAGGTYYNYGGGEASGSTGSSAASAANMDTWAAANEDRIVYGDNISNFSSGAHTTALATIDSGDALSTDALELIKRRAQDANPLIRPIMVKGDEPWYIYYVGKYGFAALRADTTLLTTMQNSLARNKDNPLFAGGDLLWDGVIVKEVPDLDKFTDSTAGGLWDGVWGAGAASADGLDNGGAAGVRVGVGFLCGAQAIGFGIGKMASFKRRKEDDYEHLNGVAISAKHDIKKTFYNGKQHGMLTHFHYAAKDT